MAFGAVGVMPHIGGYGEGVSLLQGDIMNAADAFHVVWEFSGQRMKGHREARQMSRKALGEMLAVSPDTVRFYEYGRNPPSVTSLGMMATIFGITPNDLFRRHRNEEAERAEGMAYQRLLMAQSRLT